MQEICDPARYSREAALAAANVWRVRSPSLYPDLTGFLREHCSSDHVDLAFVARALDVLNVLTPSCALLMVLRPLLRDCGPRLRSKLVLVLVRQSQNLGWANKLLEDDDARIRASVIEGLWGGKSPELEQIFLRGVADSHHRVAANAAYGLYLMDASKATPEIERLLANEERAFRSAAAWVVGKTGSTELRGLLNPLIRDRDPVVRHSGFQAMMALRSR